jgi:hypothetical protein
MAKNEQVGSGEDSDSPSDLLRYKRDEIPSAVLAVVLLVYRIANGRIQPWYIDRGALTGAGVPDDFDAAIYYAEVSGWLVGAREPPQGVAITPEGVRLLVDCALI